MPSAGLGWELLLHVERSIALLGLVGAAALVGARALGGTLPFKLGHVEYVAGDAGAVQEAVVAGIGERLQALEEQLGAAGRGERVGEADMLCDLDG